MAYGDTMAYELEEGEEKRTLHLTYNANTYFIYKRLFNGNLLNDVLKMITTNGEMPKEISEKINSGEITLENLDDLDDLDDNSFKSVGKVEFDEVIVLQIIVAMIATHEQFCGKKRSVEEIANDLPASIFSDVEFMTNFIEFLLFAIKKNKGASERLSSVLVRRK